MGGREARQRHPPSGEQRDEIIQHLRSFRSSRSLPSAGVHSGRCLRTGRGQQKTENTAISFNKRTLCLIHRPIATSKTATNAPKLLLYTPIILTAPSTHTYGWSPCFSTILKKRAAMWSLPQCPCRRLWINLRLRPHGTEMLSIFRILSTVKTAMADSRCRLCKLEKSQCKKICSCGFSADPQH